MDRVRTILTHPKIAVICVCAWLFLISSDNLHTIIQNLDKDFKWWSMYICFVGFFYVFSSPLMRQPNKPNYSKHAIIAVICGWLFFITCDNLLTIIQKLDKNFIWWSMYICLFGFFYFFYSPLRQSIKPSYSNFSRWYIAWIFTAALYHLPSLQSMGLDLRMNVSLFLIIFTSSVLFLAVFHVVYLVLWYLSLVSRVDKKQPEILAIIQKCTVISLGCCIFYSHCGNQAIVKEKPLDQRNAICSYWFAPVGSASDYPIYSKWVVYGELACTGGSCGTQSEEISPVFTLWATLVGLCVAQYVVERSPGWALTHPKTMPEHEKSKKQLKPDFLDMVPWYSGTSTDLFKTVFDLMVSVTLFVGRFDMRMMQAAMNKVPEESKGGNFLYEQFQEKDELWFDFIADTGDGGNSTYAIARLLAQPSLSVKVKVEDPLASSRTRSSTGSGAYPTHVAKELPRGDLLLIGGDLAYPNPSVFTYEKRFFRPFEDALQPPPWYKPEHIAIDKPELPLGVSELKHYCGPQCFLIPGNHDWFDGLNTFMRYICHKSWLGGWFMPQKKSYFALKLPKGWWVFGLDQALHGDIDVVQFQFFAELCRNKVGKNDSVIIMTHEPSWLLDWYSGDSTGQNVTYLIRDYLKGRCKLRMAGDLHHYMRHSCVQQPKQSDSSRQSPPVYVEHLMVNGCGGAFLHPTHVFKGFKKFYGSFYECKASYPSFHDSSRIAFGNILKFRKENWQFDFIGGASYFILVFSMFPQCGIFNILHGDSWSGRMKTFFAFFGIMWGAVLYILERSYVSLLGTVVLLVFSFMFVPTKLSRRNRVVVGFLHAAAHLSSALILMLVMELGIEICIKNRLLASSGYHTLYEWYQSMESQHFPDPTGLRARIEQLTFGLYPACIKYLMSAFDIPEVMAVTRSNICKRGLDSLPRGGAIIYYASVFIYFWILSTPVVSLIFGSYLYICINWFGIHFDEAFSSLRMANYKAFTRFHITREGDLEVYTLAVDKVPEEWKLDPDWEAESRDPLQSTPSYSRESPSKWSSAFGADPVNSVRVIDQFIIKKTPTNPSTTYHPCFIRLFNISKSNSK